MSLEAANWISELDASNPQGTDQKKQGDDHLRMIKTVLKASFPTASKAFYNPTTEVKTANFNVVAADMNKTFLVNTAAGNVTATLPTLTSGDAGWECTFLKTNTETNPLFIAPASGTIQSGDQAGLAKTRRCIPGVKSRVMWTGSAWIAERAVNVPLGAVLDVPRSGLPVGYEYAAGQTLSSASTNYPDFYQANGSSGVVTDRRGRVAIGRDDMISQANVLTGSITGASRNSVGAAIGSEGVVLTQTNLPNCTFAVNITDPGHFHATVSVGGFFAHTGSGGVRNDIPQATVDVGSSDLNGLSTGTKTTGITATASSGGSGSAFSNIPPARVTNFMVVVE